MFDYQLKLSKRRKSVAIKVTEQNVIVSAPYNVCEQALSQWLQSKKGWVEKQQQKVSLLLPVQSPFQSGTILIFGHIYTIEFADRAYIDEQAKKVYLHKRLEGHVQAGRKQLMALLTQRLKEYVLPKLAELSAQMTCQISEVKFREYKSRWGSCSSKQALTINTLLIGAPYEHIDYVLVHELVHCHVMAHNQQFWSLVATHMPSYKKSVTWFKQNGRSLFIEK